MYQRNCAFLSPPCLLTICRHFLHAWGDLVLPRSHSSSRASSLSLNRLPQAIFLLIFDMCRLRSAHYISSNNKTPKAKFLCLWMAVTSYTSSYSERLQRRRYINAIIIAPHLLLGVCMQILYCLSFILPYYSLIFSLTVGQHLSLSLPFAIILPCSLLFLYSVLSTASLSLSSSFSPLLPLLLYFLSLSPPLTSFSPFFLNPFIFRQLRD